MKKSKIFKKFLAVILAGATLSQTGFGHCETSAKSLNTSTKVLAALATVGGLAVIGLAGGLIYKSKETQKLEEKIKKLENEKTEISGALAEMQRSGATTSEEYRNLQARYNDLEGQIRSVRVELASATTELNNKKQQLADSEQEKNTAESNLRDAQSERDRFARELRSVQLELQAKKKSLGSERTQNEQITNERRILLLHSIADKCLAIAPRLPALKTHLDKLSMYLDHPITPDDIYMILYTLPLGKGTVDADIWIRDCSFVVPEKMPNAESKIADATWFHSAHMITELLTALGDSEIETLQKKFLNYITEIQSRHFETYRKSWPELSEFERQYEERYNREHISQNH